MNERRRTTGSAFAALLTLCVASGCATKGDLREVTTQLQAVTARQDSLLAAYRMQTQVTQDSLRGASDQLFEIRGSVSQMLTRIQDEISIVRQENAYNQQVLAEMRTLLQGLGQQARVPAAGSGGSGAAAQSASGARELYDVGVSTMNRGTLTAAQMSFEELLDQYPSDPLAPDARFFLGSILEEQGMLDEAVAALDMIPQLHPTSPRVPEALYRIGLIHKAEGRVDQARNYLGRAATYENSLVSEPARAALQELGPPP